MLSVLETEADMRKTLSVSDVARQLSTGDRQIKPRDITLLFYDRVLPDDLAPIRHGRRRISPAAVPPIAAAIAQRPAAGEVRE